MRNYQGFMKKGKLKGRIRWISSFLWVHQAQVRVHRLKEFAKL
jgi:hypothetical protein